MEVAGQLMMKIWSLEKFYYLEMHHQSWRKEFYQWTNTMQLFWYLPVKLWYLYTNKIFFHIFLLSLYSGHAAKLRKRH